MVLDLGCHYMARILCYVPDCIKHSNCFNSQISHSTVFCSFWALAQVVKGWGLIGDTSLVPILPMKKTVLICRLFFFFLVEILSRSLTFCWIFFFFKSMWQDSFLAICKAAFDVLVGLPILQWRCICLRSLRETFLCQPTDCKHLVCSREEG